MIIITLIEDEVMSTLEDVKNNYREVFEFKKDGSVYKRDKKALDFLNNLLATDFKAVYRSELRKDKGIDKKQNSFCWDSEDIFVVNAKDQVIILGNSEWASMKNA